MLAVARKNSIKEILAEKKSVTVSELAVAFSVTEETIRRDLKALEDEKFLIRTYGGAFIQDGVENDIESAVRETYYIENKKIIAAKCRGLINHGDSIFLDASTTAYFVADAVADMRITIVTNSQLIIDRLAGQENINLIALGGSYSHKAKSFNGKTTLEALDNYYMDKCFLSCRTLSMDKGITDSNEAVALIRQKLLSRSDNIILIADHSKFDRTSFIHICDFDSINTIVTDETLSDEWHDFLTQKGVAYYECD